MQALTLTDSPRHFLPQRSSTYGDPILEKRNPVSGFFDLEKFLWSALSATVAPKARIQFANTSTSLEVSSINLLEREKIKLIEELEEYRNVGAGWDGRSCDAPNSQCLDAAQTFVKLLPNDGKLPVVSVSGGEDVVLFWSGEKSFLVGFNANSTLSYYYANGEEEERGDNIAFHGKKIPNTIQLKLNQICNGS